jgi:hypothetical protein
MASFVAPLASLVPSHGSLLWPLPRGGVDRDLAPFNTGGWPKGRYPCTCTNGSSAGPCLPAQSCLWFSQGCTIGCPCSGNGTMSRRPNWSSCDNSTTAPTNNSPRTRSINRGAAAGSVEDVYKYMPWRAPGTAGVPDPCGVAGGDQHGVHQAAGGEYFETEHAKAGDKGSAVLAPYFGGATWRAGQVVNASWFIQANHAGGYLYRLCRAGAPGGLTEACFAATPLPFADARTVIRTANGAEAVVNATLLSEGTTPLGSTWKMNPVPECCPGASDTAAGACEARGHMCGSYQRDDPVESDCGNHQCGVVTSLGKSTPAFPWPTADPSAPPTGVAPKFAIVDALRLPADLAAGHWVLGWRWDCEETAQVWLACADITIEA